MKTIVGIIFIWFVVLALVAVTVMILDYTNLFGVFPL